MTELDLCPREDCAATEDHAHDRAPETGENP